MSLYEVGGMNRKSIYLFAVLLLGSMFGIFAYTPSDTAGTQDYCFDLSPDFHFDLEFASPSPAAAFSKSHPDTNPFPFLRVSYPMTVEFLTNVLRL
jgi:hypothetical protein